jgi:hypothetical protein
MSAIQGHIPLVKKKVLAARLVQIEASLPLEREFREKRAGTEYEELDYELPNYWNKTQAEPLKHNSVPLDVSVSELISRLDASARTKLEGDFPELLTDLQTAIKRRASHISCERCSPLHPRICDGGGDDDEITSRGGVCIAPLKKMFDLALLVSRAYYTHYGTLLNEDTAPEVVFSTHPSPSKPHDLPVDYFINGAVWYEDQPDRNRSRVEFILPAELFDRPTYLSALYIPFHECIAHAFHALTPKVERRKEANPDNRFEEGWMDWVASQVLRETIDREGLAATLQYDLPHSHKRRDETQFFHLARVKTHQFNNRRKRVEGGSVSEHAYQRQTGKNAAIKLFTLLRNHPKDCPDHWERFLQISFDLNMMSDFADVSEDFVTVIDFLEEDQELDDKIGDTILKYLKTNDIHELIGLIVGLSN